jgi:hypothetical protein
MNRGRNFIEQQLLKDAVRLGKQPHELSPDDIRSLPPIPNLRWLPQELLEISEALDPGIYTKRLSPDEIAERIRRADEFLARPAIEFPNDK